MPEPTAPKTMNDKLAILSRAFEDTGLDSQADYHRDFVFNGCLKIWGRSADEALDNACRCLINLGRALEGVPAMEDPPKPEKMKRRRFF